MRGCDVNDSTTKRCCGCGAEKPLSEFHRHSNSPDGYKARCRACRSTENKAHYQANAEHYAAYRREHASEVAAKHRAYRHANPEKARAEAKARNAVVRSRLNSLKTPCVLCGETFGPAIDFHHKDPATKSFTLSLHAASTIADLKAEADKCVSLCATCHRKYHNGHGPTVLALHEIIGGEMLCGSMRY